MMFAIIGGSPSRFRPFVDLYKQAYDQIGSSPKPLGVHSPGHIAETDEEARAQAWQGYRVLRNRIGRERGWPPADEAEFLREVSHGSMYVGSPETVAQKMASTIRVLDLKRFEMKYSQGTLAHDHLMKSIELYGTRVIPRVRALLAEG